MWRWLRPIDSKARFISSMSQSQLKPNLKCSMCSSMDMNAGAAVAVPKVNIGTFATVPCEPYKPTVRMEWKWSERMRLKKIDGSKEVWMKWKAESSGSVCILCMSAFLVPKEINSKCMNETTNEKKNTHQTLPKRTFTYSTIYIHRAIGWLANRDRRSMRETLICIAKSHMVNSSVWTKRYSEKFCIEHNQHYGVMLNVVCALLCRAVLCCA